MNRQKPVSDRKMRVFLQQQEGPFQIFPISFKLLPQIPTSYTLSRLVFLLCEEEKIICLVNFHFLREQIQRYSFQLIHYYARILSIHKKWRSTMIDPVLSTPR